ncbi:hypothetical protein VIGAN_UM161000 [Vigna angularis var. angularis]|nr:hypothetical protein VIGAN_03151900 [Vigna angularis var. angularis]BAU03702.1 hypothetical protein VIGAN_UM161000 [Vigna angularis var. angularis]
MHERVKSQIQHQTERYAKYSNKGKREVIFEEGDWVWLHLSKNRFPTQRKSKLNSRGDGPFRVVQRINNNAYRLELPCEYDVSATFNVCDLTPFVGDLEQDEDEEPQDLKTNPSQEGGDDDKLLAKGPITRSMAKQIQEGLKSFPKEGAKLLFTWAIMKYF